MATFYLDPVNGNDANAGTSFALRWKTLTAGATAARIAPGDVIRIIASPDQTSLGQSATWTSNSRDVVLTTAVNATIDNCDAAWTAATNVTATASTSTYREGTGSANLVIATAFTTGKIASHATGALNLSAYQQVSFLIRTTVALTAGQLTLTLCSDTAGATPVNTLTLPAIGSGTWVPVVIDNGSALGSSIQSVALNAVTDPGSVTINIDNIVACKAAASADSITHKSLIGKVHNLPWAASTTYAVGDKRRPTPPNRTGFQYKVSAITTGTTSGSEPTWPTELGSTVTDGGVTWRCEELEDSWYPICAISGTTLKLGGEGSVAAGADANIWSKYGGATETVATYKREPLQDGQGTNTSVVDNGSGPGSGRIVFSGGWNRTDMSTQTGETWLDGQAQMTIAINVSSRSYITLDSLNYVRYSTCVSASTTTQPRLQHVHVLASATGFSFTNSNKIELLNVVARGCNTNFSSLAQAGAVKGKCVQCDGGSTGGWTIGACWTELDYVNYRANQNASNTGLGGNSTTAGCYARIRNLVTSNNANPPLYIGNGEIELANPSIGEATPTGNANTGGDGWLMASKWGGVADDHRQYGDGCTIMSDATTTAGGSGISWKCSITATNRGQDYPVRQAIAKIACVSGVAKTVTIKVRRDNANINGLLVVRGGQVAGVSEQSVSINPSALNTWETSASLSFTPTEDGVVEVEWHTYDGVGTTNNFWVDDVSVT